MRADDFERLADMTKLRDRARRMARAVLVDGAGIAEASRREGYRSRQAAHQAVARVLRELRREGGLPQDWRAVTVMVPPDLAEKIERLARRERKRAGLSV